MARTKKGKGQADAPAPVLPETDTAPGAEAAPGEGSTAAAVPSPGPEAEGASDTTASEARGSVPADSLGDQASADAVTAPPAGEAPADPAGGSHAAEGDTSGPATIAESGGEAPKAAGYEAPPADTDDVGQLAGVVTSALADGAASGGPVSAELAAAAAAELQRLMRSDFERDVATHGDAGGDIVLQVLPTITLWRGGRHFAAGQLAELTHCDVTWTELARILAEPAFHCTFVPAADA